MKLVALLTLILAVATAAGVAPSAVDDASAATAGQRLAWSGKCGYTASDGAWVKEGCLVWMQRYRRWFWQEWELRTNGTTLVRAGSGYYLDIRYGRWYVQVTVNPATGAWVWNTASEFAIRQQVNGQWIWTWQRQMCLKAFGRYCNGYWV